MTILRHDPGNPRLSHLQILPGELFAPVTGLSIMVDIDDVIFPWYLRAHAASVAAGITGTFEGLPQTWHPWEEYRCVPEIWWEALREATHSGELYRGEPYPGAVAALWKLEAAGHFNHLVTARGTHDSIDAETKHSIMAQTQAWLHEHHVPYETLTFSHDKTVVPADVAIDDNLANYDALQEAGHYPYLHNQPWNAIPAGDNRRRVDSLAAFARIILGEDPA